MIYRSKIKCILYDFDGVMTDNRVYVTENGLESVCVNRSDGLAVFLIRQRKISQAILSTETNPVVAKRAEKLKLEVLHSISDKEQVIKEYCDLHGYDLSEVMFIGNDLNDLPALTIAGVKGCPADAATEVLEIADWVSSKKGGFGVIRDLYDWLIREA